MRIRKPLMIPALAALFGLAACGGEAELAEEPAFEEPALEEPALEAPLEDEGVVEGEGLEPGLDSDGDGILDADETEGTGY